jgi:hypothetical protein
MGEARSIEGQLIHVLISRRMVEFVAENQGRAIR